MNNHNSKGIGSLFSLLLALSLSAIPLYLLGKSSYFSTQIKKRNYQIESSIILQQYLHSIVLDTESSGFKLLPRIHPQGAVTLTNGEPIPLSKSPPLLPDRISDAITWAETELDLALRVISVDPSPSTFNYTACFALKNVAYLPEEIESFFALTRDGIFEVIQDHPHPLITTSCIKLSLSVHQSLLGHTSERFYPPGTALLIPVKRINTLYRDRQQTLRITSHKGELITENQPVRENFPVFRLKLSADRFNNFILETLIEPLSETIKPAQFSVALQLLPPDPLTIINYLQCPGGDITC